MTTEVINIQIREDGSRVVTRNIEGLGTAATKASGPLDRLKGLLATVATGAAVATLAKLADEYTNLQNRLRLVTTGTDNLKRVTKELLTVANQTRSDFTATGELYARLASTTKDLGLSQQQLLNFTKQVNQAIVLSGASASEAAGGLRQLAQGLASGTLRGDELNSVMENFPKVAQIIADGMGKSIGEIRKLGAEGKITAETIIDAFDKASGKLGEDFGKTVPTLSQSFTVLKNNVTDFIGKLNEATGVTAAISSLIIGLANNLNTIIPILTGVATAMLLVWGASQLAAVGGLVGLVTKLGVAIKGLWLLMAANPFTALLTVLAAVTVALYGMRDAIKLGIDDTTTFGDLCRSVWEDVGGFIQSVAGFAMDTWGFANDEMAESTEKSVKNQEAWWLKLLKSVANVFDAIGWVVRGTFNAILAVAQKVISNIIDNFKLLGEATSAALSGDFEGMAKKLSSNKSAFEGVGDVWGKAFSDAAQSQIDGGLVAWIDDRVKRAQEMSKDRLKNAAGGDLSGGGPSKPKSPGKGDGASSKKATQELERLNDALRSIKDTVDPVAAAERQLAEVHDTLNKSVKAGLIDLKEAKTLYDGYKETLKEQLDPLAALNKELDDQISLLKMSADQANIESQMRRHVQDLQRSGVKLTKEETDELRAKLVVEQELAKIAAARDAAEANSFAGQMKRAQEAIAGMQQANGLTEGDKFNILDQLLGGSLENTQAAMDARLEQLDNYYKIAQEFRDADVKNAQLAAQAMAAIEQERMDLRVQQVQAGLTAISGLMNSHNKTAFRIGQAAAIANATITGIQMAMNAYESASKIPYVGWLLGPLAAAGAAATAAAQISKIRSQSPPAYRTGGTYTIGGSGGTDSQVVSLRGTPGEQISINTPSQANAMERIASSMERNEGRGRGDVNMNLTVVQQGRPDNYTPEQNARAMRKQAEKMGVV